MRFDSSFIEELKARCDIVDVVGSYVGLKRAGSNYVGLCPFHNEKSPSFTVFTKSDSCYCFGCGAGGDVITFIMNVENLDYVSAIELLAKRAGLTMPVDNSSAAAVNKRKRILEMNKAAARFFNSEFASGKYKNATAYAEKRGLSGSLGKRFGIGFCPDSFGALAMHLRSLGYTSAEMKEGFLCGEGKSGKLFDYYRNRLIFPIIDPAGNVVAFGGRALGDEKPKYLNTNDTPAFKKGRNIFALNFAKNSKEDYFILCEGYTDVIALHGAGFTSAVAGLGTAFTQEQAALLKKYKEKVVICYDGDEAGRKATNRAIPILTAASLEVRALSLPAGIDPDEFLQKYGKERFRHLIDESKSEFQFKCDAILAKYNIAIPEEKIKASSEVCALLAAMTSDVERDVYTAKAAKLFDVSEESLKTDVKKKRYSLIRQEKKKFNEGVRRSAMGLGDRVNPDTVKNVRAARAEEAILGIAQINPEYMEKAEKEGILTADTFFTAFGKKVYTAIRDIFEKERKFDPAFLAGDFTPEEIGRITKIRIDRQQLSNNTYDVFAQSASALAKEKEASEKPVETLSDIEALIQSKRNK